MNWLAYILAVLSFFPRFKIKKNKQKENEEKVEKNKLLCRFVMDGAGKKIGESIAFNDDMIIIKSNGEYLGIPLKHIEESGKTLLVKGLIDQDKAIDMGENWREKSYKQISHDLDKE